MLRIAMLSFAHVHANGYARQVQDNPDAMIQCIWDDDEARGREAATKFDVPYESDLEHVLGRDDVDAVLINAPTSQHTELLLAASAKGKHIFYREGLDDYHRRCRQSRASGERQRCEVCDLAAQPHPVGNLVYQKRAGPRPVGEDHDDAGTCGPQCVAR